MAMVKEMMGGIKHTTRSLRKEHVGDGTRKAV